MIKEFLQAILGDSSGYLKVAGGDRKRGIWHLRLLKLKKNLPFPAIYYALTLTNANRATWVGMASLRQVFSLRQAKDAIRLTGCSVKA
jgi:hypothetical protein